MRRLEHTQDEHLDIIEGDTVVTEEYGMHRTFH